jgi:type IX secretion system substrate protein
MTTMKRITIRFVSVLLLSAATHFSYGQYFQELYDIDSTQEWGTNIFVQHDSNYFVIGTGYNSANNKWELFNVQVSADGSTILSKHTLHNDSLSLYSGNAGEAKQLPGGGYITPLTIEWALGSYSRGWAGFIKYNAIGDTVTLRTYTDTSANYDVILDCALMPDGGYILGGIHDMNIPTTYYPGYIVRTDSLGDTLWTHTYQKYNTQNSVINNVIPLADGRIIAAGYSTYLGDAGGIHHITYDHHTPWLMVLDNVGNILRDTIYGSEYIVGSNICGELYQDMNGGYILIGLFDSLATEYPSDLENFPGYVAHLDTNFRITWTVDLFYSAHYGHRQAVVMKQLKDSSYIVTGDAESYYLNPGDEGFAAKISSTGKLLWSHTYYSDTTQAAYMRDVAERPDGGLVFAGASLNDTLPAWHSQLDVWLVGVDSNGCQMPGGCDPDTSNGVVDTITEVTSPRPSPQVERVMLYPNPTTGNLTIKASSAGKFTLYSLLGQKIQEYKVQVGQTNLLLPVSLAAGMYMGQFKPDDGGETREVRLVYRP